MSHTLTAPDLWQSARAALNELFHLITGTSPAHLSQLKRRERKHLRDWLAALEAMVRKILLIEAAALGPPASSPACSRQKQKRRRDAGDPSAPKRAPSFTLIPIETRAPQHPARIRMLGPATSLVELLRNKARAQRIQALRDAPPPEPHARLSNRISALARVIADPAAAIRALARRLKAARQIGYAIISARVRAPFTFPGDAPRAATHRAIEAMAQSQDSS